MANFSTDKINRLLPEEILLPPIELSGRKDYTEADIASLAADIKKRGQDTPIKIRKNDAGKALLVFGRRRYLAVQYLNDHLAPGEQKRQLDCTYEAKMSDNEALIAAIQENSKRKDVNDMDHAANIDRLRKLCKLTFDQIGQIYFPEATAKDKADAVRWVRNHASLVELADEAKDAVREGTATVTAAVELAKLPKEKQREVVAAAKAAKPVAGKTRIKVSAVKAAKPAPVSRKPAAKPVILSSPAPKVPSTVYAAGEEVARVAAVLIAAVDAFLEDTDNEKAENALIAANHTALAAQTAYRKLVPFRQGEGKAA